MYKLILEVTKEATLLGGIREHPDMQIHSRTRLVKGEKVGEVTVAGYKIAFVIRRNMRYC